MSKMALLSPTKSTLFPNALFRSAGPLQSPLETISYQVPKGVSAWGYRSQKALSAFLAITFIAIACSQYGINLKFPRRELNFVPSGTVDAHFRIFNYFRAAHLQPRALRTSIATWLQSTRR